MSKIKIMHNIRVPIKMYSNILFDGKEYFTYTTVFEYICRYIHEMKYKLLKRKIGGNNDALYCNYRIWERMYWASIA